MPKTTSYTSKDIQTLDEIEHIQLNSGMYVGSTSTPTHLIEEALDNALDEALAGYANIIAVRIDTKLNKFSVFDNGRGIPLDDDTPVIISSKLFSGGKFQGRKTAYEISSGLHGVGLVAVNALSSEYSIEIYRNKQKALYFFKNTILKQTKVEQYKNERPFSTKIEFVPDKQYFETLKPDLERIRQRLTTASAEINDIKLVLIVNDQKEVFSLNKLTHFLNECVISKDVDIVEFESTKKAEKLQILFTYDLEGSIGAKNISSVNLLPVENGGTHVNYFYDVLKDYFISQAKKLDYKFQPNDVLYKLRSYIMLSLIEPKFAGQTKDRLTNRKSDLDYFFKDIKIQLDRWGKENPEILKNYLLTFQEYRKRIDAKRLSINGSKGRRASTQFTKLRDCTNRTGELYIVEGESAGGSLLQSRNPSNHAILPLKGKSIPNVTTKKDILGNKEVGELIKAIGTGIDPHFDLEKMRYSKIICATDADHDGNHIACLVTMVIGILLPEIIKEGKYFIAQTPLFAINEKKFFQPLWDEGELQEAKKNNRSITRFKGLGELSPKQLKICLMDDETRRLVPVNYSKDINSLIKLFSSAEEKRKLVIS